MKTIKQKKIFKSKELFTFDNSFCLINKNQINVEKFIDSLTQKKPIKTKYTLDEVIREILLYFKALKNKAEIIDDEYAKLILGEKYKEYISNRIDNQLDVYKAFVNVDTLTHRKVLLPKSGVLLLVSDDRTIESILLKEVFKYDCNHIVSIARFKDGTELVNIFTLEEKILNRVQYWNYTKENTNIKHNTINYIGHFLKTTKGSVDDKDAKLKYEVISPTYWKYRDRGYKSENDTTDSRGIVVKREFEVEIAPFLRKINGTASNEAQTLAKKLGIVLEDGYTIVKPHTRHYNTKK